MPTNDFCDDGAKENVGKNAWPVASALSLLPRSSWHSSTYLPPLFPPVEQRASTPWSLCEMSDDE